MATTPLLQFPTIESPMMEGSLEPEVAITLGLDSIPIVEVDSRSTSEDTHKAVESISAFEEVTPETSVPPIFGESIPVTVRGKNTNGATSSSTDLAG